MAPPPPPPPKVRLRRRPEGPEQIVEKIAEKNSPANNAGRAEEDIVDALMEGPSSITRAPYSRRPPARAVAMPRHATHKHLMDAQDVTPGITRAEYAQRRERLMQRQTLGTVAVLVATPLRLRSGDSEYDYVPNSDLWYLTGLSELRAIVVIVKTDEGVRTSVLLGSDPSRFRSDGIDEVMARDMGFDEVSRLSLDGLAAILRPAPSVLFTAASTRSASLPVYEANPLDDMVKQALNGKEPREELAEMVADLRYVKSPAEVALLKAVFGVTARAHNWLMKMTAPKVHEAEMKGIASYFLEKEYAPFAYSPIIASGIHGRILHYSSDNDVMRAGDLVLMDVGGQRFGYCADLTRTWPVSCKFSAAQRKAYELVLQAQETAYEAAKRWKIKPITFRGLEQLARSTLRAGLQELGFKEGPETFLPHRITHPLGIDVHDCAASNRVTVEEGVVFTIEPGLYFPDDETVPAEYRGISIRIEDDCIATATSVECPTFAAARTVEAIEAICGRERRKRRGRLPFL